MMNKIFVVQAFFDKTFPQKDEIIEIPTSAN